MQVGSEQSPEQIFVAMTKEADSLAFLRIWRINSLEVGHVEPIVETVDERGNQPAIVKNSHPLRRRKDEIRVACVQTVGGEKLANQNRQIHGKQDRPGYNGYPVAAELPPHHSPLRRHIEAFLCGRHPLDRIGVERRARDVMWKLTAGMNERRVVADARRVAGREGYIAHLRRPACSRIRGS